MSKPCEEVLYKQTRIELQYAKVTMPSNRGKAWGMHLAKRQADLSAYKLWK